MREFMYSIFSKKLLVKKEIKMNHTTRSQKGFYSEKHVSQILWWPRQLFFFIFSILNYHYGYTTHYTRQQSHHSTSNDINYFVIAHFCLRPSMIVMPMQLHFFFINLGYPRLMERPKLILKGKCSPRIDLFSGYLNGP